MCEGSLFEVGQLPPPCITMDPPHRPPYSAALANSTFSDSFLPDGLLPCFIILLAARQAKNPRTKPGTELPWLTPS